MADDRSWLTDRSFTGSAAVGNSRRPITVTGDGEELRRMVPAAQGALDDSCEAVRTSGAALLADLSRDL